jgi:hypothetical protein
LQNLRFLVCQDCYDTPQPQLKPRIIGPDPLPILNARPENFYVDETDFLVSTDGSQYTTEDGLNYITHGTSIYPDSSTVSGFFLDDRIDQASFTGTIGTDLYVIDQTDTMVFSGNVAPVTFLVDQFGNFIVDQFGNRIIVG